MKKIVFETRSRFRKQSFLSKSVTPASGIRQQQNIFLLQIQLLWNPHFRAPVCFAIFHCSQLHSAFFRNEMFHSNGSSQISDSLTGNTFSSPGLSTVARKCARMPTARISSAISRSFTCSVTPQSTARSVCASTRSAAEMFLQPDKIAAVRVFGFWKIPSAVP